MIKTDKANKEKIKYLDISKEKISKIYKEKEKWFHETDNKENRVVAKNQWLKVHPKMKLIGHLSDRLYECYSDNACMIAVWGNKEKDYFYIGREEIEPRSIREKLHNIEEAKEFYLTQPTTPLPNLFNKDKHV